MSLDVAKTKEQIKEEILSIVKAFRESKRTDYQELLTQIEQQVGDFEYMELLPQKESGDYIIHISTKLNGRITIPLSTLNLDTEVGIEVIPNGGINPNTFKAEVIEYGKDYPTRKSAIEDFAYILTEYNSVLRAKIVLEKAFQDYFASAENVRAEKEIELEEIFKMLVESGNFHSDNKMQFIFKDNNVYTNLYITSSTLVLSISLKKKSQEQHPMSYTNREDSRVISKFTTANSLSLGEVPAEEFPEEFKFAELLKESSSATVKTWTQEENSQMRGARIVNQT